MNTASILIAGVVIALTTQTVHSEESAMSTNAAISSAAGGNAGSIYNFAMKDIDGQDVKLADYKGKVVMIVNVASKCGFTPQYKGLEALYLKYKERGLVILGFPANDFLRQEPGTEKDIKAFCTLNYGVTFPMFSKIKVTGKDRHPLYQYLTGVDTNPQFAGDITWNFNKFLIGRDGKIINRFGSRTAPEDESIIKAVESALGAVTRAATP